MKCKYLLFIIFPLLGLNSCKKDSEPVVPTISIIGKWYITTEVSVLYGPQGQTLNTINENSFGTSDFVEYFKDGSGYYSIDDLNKISLLEFTYTVSGKNLVQFNNPEDKGIPRTITDLTASKLSVHTEMAVSDPNNPTITDTEIDDLTFKR